ncbi:hypothetical protein TSAR_003979 [Trichomalopsis sarcophagae]|uniref:Peptidase S1 domain-containing protein n=1 Tax=Trichomalopsis sarcophagae TaxID=543379 RepID=A0A232ENB6_9HYME|nr:hypothetical protein TSAR_003979 [Trichomalopsis sarcophagae]
MLAKAVGFSLWILLSFTIFRVSRATEPEEDSNAYCDDEYRSKYIVTKSLFPLGQKVPVVNYSISSRSHHDGTGALTGSKNASSRDNDSDYDHCQDRPRNNRRSLATGHRRSSSDEFSTWKSIVGNGSSSDDRKKHRPISILIKAVIGIDLERSVSNELTMNLEKSRRKRTLEAWEGENTCRPGRRVIGGSAAKDIEDLPYMVFVDSGCGGSVIGDSWILTASHCINPDGPVYVYAGSLKLHGGCRHKIERIVKHPKYDEKLFIFDVALLKLFQPLIFSPAIKAIPMSLETPRPGDCGLVSGWGATMLNGTMVYDMRTTLIPVVAKRRCSMFKNIGEGQFCAGFRDAQSDTCQGDSGGPFVVNGSIVGIVSYGYKCAIPETPGVYVDVAYFRRWIENVTGI